MKNSELKHKKVLAFMAKYLLKKLQPEHSEESLVIMRFSKYHACFCDE